MSSPLKFTGERFHPDQAGDMWNEHWHRYHFVMPIVTGKRVLDVACGEGYGAALIARVASSVVGVDISGAAIEHARMHYGDKPALEFINASCDDLPFPDAQFDVVVSFETIEHIHNQAAFLSEIRRVLKPDGVLIMSSPNKTEYSDARGYQNEFHVKELYADELANLVLSYFSHTRWWSQRNGFYSLIAPASGNDSSMSVEVVVVSKESPQDEYPALPALYFILTAANDAATLAKLTLGTSAFTDAEEFAMNDYRKIYRELVALSAMHRDLQLSYERLKDERDQLLRDRSPPQ